MKAVVGEEALNDDDRKFLKFHDEFEQQFVNQGEYENRNIFDSLDKSWELLSQFQRDKLAKIKDDHKDKYFAKVGRQDAADDGQIPA